MLVFEPAGEEDLAWANLDAGSVALFIPMSPGFEVAMALIHKPCAVQQTCIEDSDPNLPLHTQKMQKDSEEAGTETTKKVSLR